MKSSTLFAEGITCGGCAGALKRAVGVVPGVASVEVDVQAKRLTVTHEVAVTRDVLERAVRTAGFTPGEGGER